MKEKTRAIFSFVVGILLGVFICTFIILPLIVAIIEPSKENLGVEIGTVDLWPGDWFFSTTDNVRIPETCFKMRTYEYKFPEYDMHLDDAYWTDQPDEERATSLRFIVNNPIKAVFIDYCTMLRITPMLYVYRRTEEGEGEYPGLFNIKWVL
jgi:hypothetical protein